MINFDAAEKLVELADKSRIVDYEDYFNELRPRSLNDIFRRGVFAFASVHTTWESNINLFAELWDLDWLHDPDLLRAHIVRSKAGLVNNRTKALMKFAAMFWQYPDLVSKKAGESWYDYRDRLEKVIFGLGPAKTAFFIELMHFHDSRISCFDTHMLQAYGIKPPDVGNVKPTELARMEMHWDMTCKKHDINPVTCRWILWDRKQGKHDSRYWSYVLEAKPVSTDPQLELFRGELGRDGSKAQEGDNGRLVEARALREPGGRTDEMVGPGIRVPQDSPRAQAARVEA